MFQYAFTVPEEKRVRLIIHTDCKNEADDQFAVVHQLLSPKFDVRGIIAGHFEQKQRRYPKGQTARASFEEIEKLLDLMGLTGQYPVIMGASQSMPDMRTPVPSPGAEFIIAEAMRDDPRPLYIGMQGAITDLASAILMEPEICSRMTAIWIGGGNYPDGSEEFNLLQDVNAANAVFASQMPLWQVPQCVYKQFAVTLAELQLKVKPYGRIGAYLFQQMADFNLALAKNPGWPHGETWGLGDQGVIGALLQEEHYTETWYEIPAPQVTPDYKYLHPGNNRPIRVYKSLNARATLEDFFAKLQLQFPTPDA